MRKHNASPIIPVTFLRGVAMLATFIVLLLIGGCSEPGIPRGKYLVIDSGGWVAEGTSGDGFVWLDDHRIAFVSSKSFRHDADDTQHVLAIWNVGEKPEIFREKVTGINCYDNKELGYWRLNRWTGKANKFESFKGPLGKEKPWDKLACKRYRRNFTLPLMGNGCECLDGRNEPWVTRNAYPLQPGHGWIDLGSDWKTVGSLDNLPVTYHRPAGGAVPMPFKSREWIRLSFHPFRGAYFIEGDYFNLSTKGNQSPWPKNLPRYAWWLEPDGKVTPIVIPPIMQNKRGYWGELVPTKIGIATVSRGGEKSNHDPGEQGVYLINGEHVEKILDGTVDRMGVSPNGCRLAVANAPNNATDHLGEYDKQFRTMKVIELCNPLEGK